MPPQAAKSGEVVERLKALAWKASRRDKRLEGSNPSLSESLVQDGFEFVGRERAAE